MLGQRAGVRDPLLEAGDWNVEGNIFRTWNVGASARGIERAFLPVNLLDMLCVATVANKVSGQGTLPEDPHGLQKRESLRIPGADFVKAEGGIPIRKTEENAAPWVNPHG